MNKVLLKEFKPEKLDRIVSLGFKEFKIDRKLSQVESVFIKPNLVSDVPEYIKNGSNSDIRLIEAILKYLNQNFSDVKVYLGESDTGTKVKGRQLSKALEYMGVVDLEKKYNFEIVNLTKDKKVEIEIPNGKHLKKVKMGKTLMQSDLIINIPKIKTHKYATITCALKNMFGCIPDPLRIVYHENIHQVVADLNRLFYEKMFIVTDGIICMEGKGPLYGTPVELGLLMFANNPLFNDFVASKIMKISADEIRHLKLVNKWADEDLDNVLVKGNVNLKEKSRGFKPATKNWFVKLEEKLMQHRWIVKILFSNWFRKNITYHINPLLKKLRGGSYSWYIKKKKNENY